MKDSQIERINELARKSKKEGLTEQERIEQANLRSQYIQSIRSNLRGQLNNISLLNPDGSVTDLAQKDKTKSE
ncbi:MAG: DUF896 domain-containing protein [Velocimicrobium sp.]